MVDKSRNVKLCYFNILLFRFLYCSGLNLLYLPFILRLFRFAKKCKLNRSVIYCQTYKRFPVKKIFKHLLLPGFILAITGLCCFSQTMHIGDKYGGGIVFYLDGTGQHGLIAALNDLSSATQWGCKGTSIGGTRGGIGKGKTNTTDILNGCSDSDIAALICHNLSLNGFNDWFLPSKGELNQMYLNKNSIGSFANDEFWSSSEASMDNAWVQNFTNGKQENCAKNNLKNVRAIRAF